LTVEGGVVATVEIGLRGEAKIKVGRKDLASSMGNPGAEVLSTPRLIGLLEEASRAATAGRLPAGSITVGSRVDVTHLAATPLGSKVRAEAFLREVDGRRLIFEVVAYDEFEKVAAGIHERFVVSKDRFLEKVRQKIKEQSGSPEGRETPADQTICGRKRTVL
jgi:predicted thioesterase